MTKELQPLSEAEVKTMLALVERASGVRVQMPTANKPAEWVTELHVAFERPYQDLLALNEDLKKRRARFGQNAY